MPEIYNDWIPMNPAIPACPECGIERVAALSYTDQTLGREMMSYRCEACGYVWEEECGSN